MFVDEQAGVLYFEEALLPLRLVLESNEELSGDECPELALLIILVIDFCLFDGMAHNFYFPVALSLQLALELLVLALLHILVLGRLH